MLSLSPSTFYRHAVHTPAANTEPSSDSTAVADLVPAVTIVDLLPASNTGPTTDFTAITDLVPATGPTSDFTAVVHSETEEVPAAEMMCLMYVNGEDLLWSATSLDLFSPGNNLCTNGLQMAVVDHQYSVWVY